MDAVQELEHYLSKNTLDQLVKDMMVATLKEKPEEPSHFLLKWLLLKHAGKGSDEVSVASCPAGAEVSMPEASVNVAVCHTDRDTQQYLMDKKVPNILLELLKQIAKEKPDNPLGFVALQAHNLHKSPPPELELNT